jgi:hypothetical protein
VYYWEVVEDRYFINTTSSIQLRYHPCPAIKAFFLIPMGGKMGEALLDIYVTICYL